MTKLIQKKFQGALVDNKVLNTQSSSQTDTYSCDYINSIIETYNSADGSYIKFSNGWMIQTKHITTSFQFLAWYNDIAYKDFNMGDWIVPFVNNTAYVIGDNMAFMGGPDNQAWPTNSGLITNTSAGTFRACRPADAGMSITWNVNLYRTAIGRWK